MPLTAEQEVIIRDYVKRYSNIERLTPFRTKQLLKAALSEDKPEAPPADACCGCSCSPCVKDLWQEEVQLWKDGKQLLEDQEAVLKEAQAAEAAGQVSLNADHAKSSLFGRIVQTFSPFSSRPASPAPNLHEGTSPQ